MVLPPPVGILGREDTIDSIGAGSRWRSVSFRERHCAFPAAGTAVLAYVAHAERGDGGAYPRSAVRRTSATTDDGSWCCIIRRRSRGRRVAAPDGPAERRRQQTGMKWLSANL